MAISLTTSRQAAELNGVKCLVYGKAGYGKTRLCATAPNPIIISAEGGLLSLREFDIPVIEVHSPDELQEAYDFIVGSAECKQFETVCLDSISEIAECMLNYEKKNTRDPRAAYGNTNERMTDYIRMFRDLRGKHVYFSAKQELIKDETLGITMYASSMPGKTLTQQLPYFFDEVFKLDKGTTADGVTYSYLLTSPTIQSDAKDRSGALEMMEEPDLTKVFNKIINGRPQS